MSIAIDLLPPLPFSRHIPKLNAVLRTRDLVGGKFVVASVVLHAGDARSALLLLAATPKEEGSNQDQGNTGNRSNDDTGDGTTAKFVRASRLSVELGRTVGRAGAAGTVGGAGAIRVAGTVGVCPPGGGCSRVHRCTSRLVILTRLGGVEARDREAKGGFLHKGDVGTRIEGLVMRSVPVSLVDDLERRLAAGRSGSGKVTSVDAGVAGVEIRNALLLDQGGEIVVRLGICIRRVELLKSQ